MNKKVAVPADENGVLEGHFGHCQFFEIFEIADNQIISHEKLVPPPHEPGVLPKWLAGNGVTDVLAGGIGDGALKILAYKNINVFKGVPALPVAELIEKFLNGTLELSDNSCNDDHHEHEHHHHHQHHHKHHNGHNE
ncbi:MAG TPA: NifB/NifX family molybdenum-iron cluster-binding protein [Draconibacterium sp.]|nr:NifB/NifX family molybdenum-iron cluster-binding protein [Draconibacterium sp.]